MRGTPMPHRGSAANVAGDTRSDPVTARGWDILRPVVVGRANREIGAELSIIENIARSTCNASRSGRGSAIEPQSASGRAGGSRTAERGQAAVEFVLLFPLIIGIILAVIEFGFIMYTFTTVNASAREAARFAAVANEVGDCDEGIIGRAVEVGAGNVDCPDVTVIFVDRTDPPDGVAGRGDGVVVRVAHEYQMITPIGALFEAFSFGTISPTIDMKACAAARLEAVSQEPTPTFGSNCS